MTLSSKLQCIIKKCTCRHTQRKRRSSLPWINADVLKKMKERDLALKRAIKTNRPHDKHHFAMRRNAVTSMLRKSRANFFLAIISEARGNTKLVWDQLKK